MGLTKQLYESYVLDGSKDNNYYENISYIRGYVKPKKSKKYESKKSNLTLRSEIKIDSKVWFILVLWKYGLERYWLGITMRE